MSEVKLFQFVEDFGVMRLQNDTAECVILI